MIAETIARLEGSGRIARIRCVRNDALAGLPIRSHCFLLLILHEGEAKFQVGDSVVTATAPCFVCFGETEEPVLLRKRDLVCDSIYFHPTFLNVNLTFERIKDKNFPEVAMAHDLFLLHPFTDPHSFVLPLPECFAENTKRLFDRLDRELELQPDFYWSCRSRTFFMEIIFMLERLYGLIGRAPMNAMMETIHDRYVREAVLFVESHFSESISLEDISRAAALNHTSLSRLFKAELGVTPVEYVWRYRIAVARKHLEFTYLPIKEIAAQCGFKTVQHFSRKFEESMGCSPSEFRKMTFEARVEELQ